MQRPSELSKRLDPSQLLGHFVAGRSVPLEPAGWYRRQLDGWILVHEPRLPVHELLDSAGTEIGWLLGHPIDLRLETVVTGPLQTPLQPHAREVGPGFENWLYEFGGRFAAIVLQPKPVVYPDAIGTLPVLFDAKLQCLASSPFLLCSPDGTVPDSPLVDALAVFSTGRWFPLGTSSHARADYLLPNHALDLARWKQFRTWPSAPLDSDDVGTLVERVATTLEKTIKAVAASGHPNLGLTAGGDSRSLLACSRDVLDRVRFFTVAQPDGLGTTDLATAPALARRFGLEYRVLPWIEPSRADVELFMYRTGCLLGEYRGRRAAPTYNQLGGGEVYMSAVDSEIAAAFGWRGSDDPTLRLGPEELLRRHSYSLQPEFIRRTSDWLAALPKGLNGLDAMTLFHIEMMCGAGFGPLTMAYPDAYTFSLYPYSHRAFVDTALRLPYEYRRAVRLREDVIAARWKELLDIPFNRRPVRVAVRRKARKWGVVARAGLSREAWGVLFRKTSSKLLPPSGR